MRKIYILGTKEIDKKVTHHNFAKPKLAPTQHCVSKTSDAGFLWGSNTKKIIITNIIIQSKSFVVWYLNL